MYLPFSTLRIFTFCAIHKILNLSAGLSDLDNMKKSKNSYGFHDLLIIIDKLCKNDFFKWGRDYFFHHRKVVLNRTFFYVIKICIPMLVRTFRFRFLYILIMYDLIDIYSVSRPEKYGFLKFKNIFLCYILTN